MPMNGRIGGMPGRDAGLKPDNSKRGKDTQNHAPQYQQQEDPYPEFVCTDAFEIGISRVHLRVDIIAEERAAARGTRGMKYRILVTACGAGEGSFCSHNNTLMQCLWNEIKSWR